MSSEPSAPMPEPSDYNYPAPPPYSTLPPNSNPIESPFSSPSARPISNENSRLSFIDFLPRFIKKQLFAKEQFESFEILTKRLNEWLSEHSDITIINIESIVWFGPNYKQIYTDDTTFHKTYNNHYLNGIRLWYYVPLVPKPSQEHQQLSITVCTLPHKPVEDLSTVMNTINNSPSPLPLGDIIGMETIETECVDGMFQTQNTHWKLQTGEARHIFFALRFFILEDSTKLQKPIGYKDFVPAKANRNKDNGGYELFSEVADRASRWMVRNPQLSLINPQLINVKLKNDIPMVDRGRYKDNCSNLLRVLRIYHTTQCWEPRETRLSYRTFRPMEQENMRTMMDRINKWILHTRAKVKSIQTVVTHSSISLSSEATSLHNRTAERQQGKYVFQIRLFLDGDYNEDITSSTML